MSTSSPAPDTVRGYFRRFREHHSLEAVVKALETLKRQRVLVIGDLIVDEYCYCRVSGTVSKWPVIAAVYEDLRRMAGGGAVIARHAREFAAEVTYVCTVGDRDEHGAFARGVLADEGITPRFFAWPGSFTVAKRRYITGGYPNPLTGPPAPDAVRGNIRLFEIGFMPPPVLPEDVETAVCRQLEQELPRHDAVIVADFGHGFVTPRIADTVAKHARWWAVNAQTNSTNFGFNLVTKYRGAHFVCIDELEARLPVGSRSKPLEEVVAVLRSEIGCRDLMVTRGSDGLMLFGRNGTCHAPALATAVVDTVGAGDAVLTLASLASAAGLDDPVTVFLGSGAGAIASSIVGNAEPVRKERLLTWAREALQ